MVCIPPDGASRWKCDAPRVEDLEIGPPKLRCVAGRHDLLNWFTLRSKGFGFTSAGCRLTPNWRSFGQHRAVTVSHRLYLSKLN